MPSENGDSSEQDEVPREGPGMLTKAQREYLQGESDIEEGSQRERTIRSRIRGRLYNGISDISLALWRLEARDINQVRDMFSDDISGLHSATGRMLMLNSLPAEEAISNDMAREIRIGNGAVADYGVNVLPSDVETFFQQSMKDFHIQGGSDDWKVRDVELSSTVAFDRSVPDTGRMSTVELRDLITRYERDEISLVDFVERLLQAASEDEVIDLLQEIEQES
jgi:hypothetical protein